MSTPPTVIEPQSARSSPAMRLSSVLLPEPEGPISARNSPAAMESEIPSSTGMSWAPRR